MNADKEDRLIEKAGEWMWQVLEQFTRMAEALEKLAAHERRKAYCRVCGRAECEGHATLPLAEGPDPKQDVVNARPLDPVVNAHQGISAAATLADAEGKERERWARRYAGYAGPEK